MNSRSVGIFALVVAVIVGAALWFLNSEHAPHYSPVTSVPPTPPPKATIPNTPQPGPVAGIPQVVTPKPAPAKVDKPEAQMTEDDRKIDQALRAFAGNSDADHANTAQLLINMLPTLTADGQVEAAQHIANLLVDEQYQRVLPVWRNPASNPDVIDVLATDLMNRDQKVMLPAMLDAVKMPTHPYHEEAKSNLQIFLDVDDFGSDVSKWEKAMKDYLAKEAAEEAASPQ